MKHIFFPYFKDVDEVKYHGWSLDTEREQADFVENYQQLQNWFVEISELPVRAMTKKSHCVVYPQYFAMVDTIKSKDKHLLLDSEQRIIEYGRIVDYDYDKTTKLDMDIALARCKMLMLRDILSSLKVREEVVKLLDVRPKGFCSTTTMEKVYRNVEDYFWDVVLN